MEMSITGVLRYGAVYGPCVELRRTITSRLGGNTIDFVDEFFNAGNQAVPHQWLLHVNLGYPLIDGGAEFCYDASKVDAQDNAASRAHFKEGINYKQIPNPLDAHHGPESVVAYLYPKPDAQGRATVGVVNAKLGLGFAIHYSTKDFPRCGNWQHWGRHEYVTALEPMNGGVDGRDKDRARGWLDSLAPGGRKTYQYQLEVVTSDGLDRLRALNGK